jgi:hypothetical protein
MSKFVVLQRRYDVARGCQISSPRWADDCHAMVTPLSASSKHPVRAVTGMIRDFKLYIF